jgi:hypothetical protein
VGDDQRDVVQLLPGAESAHIVSEGSLARLARQTSRDDVQRWNKTLARADFMETVEFTLDSIPTGRYVKRHQVGL